MYLCRPKPACPRPSAGTSYSFPRSSEDCLYLNVFTKNLARSEVSQSKSVNSFYLIFL